MSTTSAFLVWLHIWIGKFLKPDGSIDDTRLDVDLTLPRKMFATLDDDEREVIDDLWMRFVIEAQRRAVQPELLDKLVDDMCERFRENGMLPQKIPDQTGTTEYDLWQAEWCFVSFHKQVYGDEPIVMTAARMADFRAHHAAEVLQLRQDIAELHAKHAAELLLIDKSHTMDLKLRDDAHDREIDEVRHSAAESRRVLHSVESRLANTAAANKVNMEQLANARKRLSSQRTWIWSVGSIAAVLVLLFGSWAIYAETSYEAKEWSCPGARCAELPAAQNVHHVAADAYPVTMKIVDRWVTFSRVGDDSAIDITPQAQEKGGVSFNLSSSIVHIQQRR